MHLGNSQVPFSWLKSPPCHTSNDFRPSAHLSILLRNTVRRSIIDCLSRSASPQCPSRSPPLLSLPLLCPRALYTQRNPNEPSSSLLLMYASYARKKGKRANRASGSIELILQGPKKWFPKCDKHYPSRSGQTSLATAVTNITTPVTKNNFGHSICGNF